MSSPKPIGWYVAYNTPNRIVNDGLMDPVLERAETPDDCDRKAVQIVKENHLDPDESWVGCLTVYEDGTVSMSDYSASELEGDR